MTTRRTVARRDEVPPGEARVVHVDGQAIALVNVDGRYFAIDNRCPHRGGPLGEGALDGAILTCPWHGWQWDVTTGNNVNHPGARVRTLPVCLEGDALVLEFPDGTAHGRASF